MRGFAPSRSLSLSALSTRARPSPARALPSAAFPYPFARISSGPRDADDPGHGLARRDYPVNNTPELAPEIYPGAFVIAKLFRNRLQPGARTFLRRSPSAPEQLLRAFASAKRGILLHLRASPGRRRTSARGRARAREKGLTLPSRREDDVAHFVKKMRKRRRGGRYPSSRHDKFVRPLSYARQNRLRHRVQCARGHGLFETVNH